MHSYDNVVPLFSFWFLVYLAICLLSICRISRTTFRGSFCLFSTTARRGLEGAGDATSHVSFRAVAASGRRTPGVCAWRVVLVCLVYILCVVRAPLTTSLLVWIAFSRWLR